MEVSLDLPLFSRGKVRDNYDLGDRLLLVATDRLSAFDCVLPTGIPDRGRVLTGLSAFWFERLAPLVRTHYITMDPDRFPPRAHAVPGGPGGARDARSPVPAHRHRVRG